MHLETNPFERKGKRNVWCKYYSSCLDYAISHSWQHWYCGKCKHLSDRYAGVDVVSTESESMDHFEIPDSIYRHLF